MKRLISALHSWLWHPAAGARPLHLQLLTTVGRYLFGLARDVSGGQLSLHAMSLVYSTLLAAVPLIAFSFSVLKGLN
ncbi:MAG: ribonuclease BN, partial [Pseudomonadota bacterium]